MTRLILSVALPALLLGACATMTPDGGAAAVILSSAAQTPPPHLPSDLSPAGVRAADENLYLEEVHGERAMAFVAQANARTAAVLETDPRYETFRQQAFAILSAQDRIAMPHAQAGMIFNFWQDATNPKGLWRRTTLASYRTAAPAWETVIDLDALARSEGKDWVWKGADCLAPDETRCLINLSEGGKDAVLVREFDTATRRFVTDGFTVPEGKHSVEWLDRDTLLLATDFGLENGTPTLTESGYAYIIKAMGRGQTLAQAREVFRGDVGDGGYGVTPSVFRDAEGRVEAVIINRPVDTFRSEVSALGSDGRPYRLVLPGRSTVYGVLDGRLVFTVEEDWTFDGQPYPSGALIAAPLARLGQGERDAAMTGRNEALVFAPNARQSIDGVSITNGRIVAAVYDNVRGGVASFAWSQGRGWTRTDIPTVANTSVNLVDAGRSSDQVFYSVEGFLTPSTLMLADAATGATETIRTSPARFDAATHVVEQFQAASSDGTQIPYFVVRPRALVMDGSAPTIVYGYGGFQVSKPPIYIPEMGKLWLENGGVFVNANIRGGGEFGPSWHQSVLRERRQLNFDDYTAVIRDLHARRISSPEHTGIYGRSNGGVLTSVAMTQNPELFNAAVIESPLIDMLRYHEMPAGASWIGEFGDPRVPEDAAFLARYSAYQQLRPEVDYPVVYITTNTRDDRVHPGHGRKFSARLTQQGHEHLYYEQTAGGHSNDADPVANARRWARHYTYLAQRLMD